MTFVAADKLAIIQELKTRVSNDLNAAQDAFDSARDHATGEEMKAEGKYDTRSIEAGYFAGAQQKRVHELEQEQQLLDEMCVEHTTEQISVGSLVSIEFRGTSRLYFISSTSGGTILTIKDTPVLIISAFSPLGSEAIGLQVGDSFEVESKSETREYQIRQVW